jgi:hypothetical protein
MGTMFGDATNWNEDAYKESVLKEREIQTQTVFRTAWAPSQSQSQSQPQSLFVASSDGSIASYSLPSTISASKLKNVYYSYPYSIHHFTVFKLKL